MKRGARVAAMGAAEGDDDDGTAGCRAAKPGDSRLALAVHSIGDSQPAERQREYRPQSLPDPGCGPAPPDTPLILKVDNGSASRPTPSTPFCATKR